MRRSRELLVTYWTPPARGRRRRRGSAARERRQLLWRASAAIAGVLVLVAVGLYLFRVKPAQPVPLRSFALYDVQEVFGGKAIWATDDRLAFIQIVGPNPLGRAGLWEKRYRVKLTRQQWAEAEFLVGRHHMLAVKTLDRKGAKDEAHPTIMLVTKEGVTVKTSKWGNDIHADFDPVYGFMLALCRGGGELLREGEFESKWLPAGFQPPW